MPSWLQEIDVQIFRLINGTAGGFLDPIMVVLSSRVLWLLCGCVFIAISIFRKNRHLFLGCVFVLLTLGVADLVTYKILKPSFDRDRPCYQLENVTAVERCGSRQGFPSNHAANGMAAAVAACLYFGFRRGGFLVPIAIVVGATRIYLGVHFPLDIAGGFFAGVLYAILCWMAWRPLQGRLESAADRLPFFSQS